MVALAAVGGDVAGGVVAAALADLEQAAQGAAEAAGGAERGEPVGLDRDRDTVPDVDDNCPDVPNPFQSDKDQDGSGDACE